MIDLPHALVNPNTANVTFIRLFISVITLYIFATAEYRRHCLQKLLGSLKSKSLILSQKFMNHITGVGSVMESVFQVSVAESNCWKWGFLSGSFQRGEIGV